MCQDRFHALNQGSQAGHADTPVRGFGSRLPYPLSWMDAFLSNIIGSTLQTVTLGALQLEQGEPIGGLPCGHYG